MQDSKHTPLERYNGIWVKREDLCFDDPAPPFSKNRGVIAHLNKLKLSGTKVVGYTETSISMAGWGVAWACSLLGMKAVIFDPQYKKTPEVLKFHREQWSKFSPDIIPVKAGMAKVNYHVGKNILREKYGKDAVMLPLGLPFEETISQTAQEVHWTLLEQIDKKFNSIVTCVGSGTICAGILQGLAISDIYCNLYGIMTRTGNVELKRKSIFDKSRVPQYGIWSNDINMDIIDMGWEYTTPSKADCPFPTHAYYDLKAWEWLLANKSKIPSPILFWNIGH